MWWTMCANEDSCALTDSKIGERNVLKASTSARTVGKAMSAACCIDVPTTVQPVDHERQPRQSLSQPSAGSTCCLAKREDTDMTRVVVNQRLKLGHVNGHLGQEAVPLAQSLRSDDAMQSNNDTAFGNCAENASRAAGCAHGSHGFLVGLASAPGALRLGTTNRLTETSPDCRAKSRRSCFLRLRSCTTCLPQLAKKA